MALTPGTRFGAYEIAEAIGAGGMGEVYRARDQTLERDVAIKVMPPSFALDENRVARFEQEAKTLASLNHVNIAHIYGLERSDGTTALAMELVEGPTLAERIEQGPIPPDEALNIALQIADGLEAAHARGIVHRDLKPANIKLATDGTVKVLDFGIAKALDNRVTSGPQAPALTTPAMTEAGIVLGTAQYMSPEQARGKQVDQRADIWAFGCVLYEMLTGQPAFGGEDVTIVLARVLERGANLDALPADLSPAVRQAIKLCLQKDPKKRVRDIGDVKLALEGAFETAAPQTNTAASAAPRGRRVWMAAFTVALLVAVALAIPAVRHLRETPPVAQRVQLQLEVPPTVSLDVGREGDISPDGRTLAFLARSTDGVTRVWVRELNALDARALPGSENAANKLFWSFDSRFLVFESGGKIKRISLAGGPTTTLCDVPAALVGGFSTPEGVVIFGTTQVIYRVAWDGGRPEAVTRLDPARQETYHALPVPLPDGRHFLYLRASSNPEQSGIFVGAVDAKAEDSPSPRVLGTPNGAQFVRTSATGPGQILFMLEGALMHQGFDPGRMVLIGDAAPVASPVGSYFASGLFSVSNDGTIVYRTDNPLSRQLAWFDRQGMKLTAVGEPDTYTAVALAPDGAHAIAVRSDAQTNRDLWLLDFMRATRSRFAFGQFRLWAPVWSPDSQRIVFQSNELGSFGLYEKGAAGVATERLLFKSAEGAMLPTSVSPDGQSLLFHAGANSDLWLLPLNGNDAKAVPLLQTAFNEQDGRFSPDGRLIAWQSNEGGRNEIYVGVFDAQSPERFSTNERIVASRGGGTGPRWRADGKELFYTSPDGQVMAVPVSTGAGIGAAIQAGTPVPLFTLPEGTARWEPVPDGQRFLELVPLAEARAPFIVLLNWAAGLTP